MDVERGDNSPPPLLGRPGDAWWLWAPLPILGVGAWLLGAFGEPMPRGVALNLLFLLNFLHLGATWTRLYGDGRKEHSFAAYLLPAALLILCGALVHFEQKGPLLLMVFLANIPHIGLQNFGFIQISAAQKGAWTKVDRDLDKAYQVAIPLYLALWFASRPGADLFHSEAIGLDKIPPVFMATLGTVIGAFALGVFARMLYLKSEGRPVPRLRWALHLLYGPGMLAAFVFLPPELAPIPIAGTHYIQYLVFVRRYHHRAGLIEGRSPIWGRVHPVIYLLLLACLAPGIPIIVNTALEPLLGSLIPAIGAAASLHHFLVDGLIWRMREPTMRRRLLVMETKGG